MKKTFFSLQVSPNSKFLLLSLFLFVFLAFSTNPISAAPNAIFTVTKTADTADGTCDADCSLREAVIAANASVGADEIILPAGTYALSIVGTGEDAAATGDLDITDDLTITGSGVSSTVIDASGIDRVFHRVSTTTINVTFSDMTIRGGSLAVGNLGAGIASDNSTTGTMNLTLNSVLMTANITLGDGGAIGFVRTASGNPTLTMNNSTLDQNEATNGGGIQCGGCTLNITNSTISGNTASTSGGGINVTSNSSNLSLSHITISGNTADVSGGGIAKLSGNGIIALNFATVSLNIADDDTSSTGDGGGINSNGSTTIQNSIVQGNTDRSPAGTDDCAGTVASNDYNVVGAGTGCPSGGANDSTSAANLGGLADNGGPTLTQLPGVGSAATNRVTNGLSGCVGGTSTDQRGAVRAGGAPNNGSTDCDSGSVEGDSSETPTAVTLTNLSIRNNTPFWVAGLAGILLMGGALLFLRLRKTKTI